MGKHDEALKKGVNIIDAEYCSAYIQYISGDIIIYEDRKIRWSSKKEKAVL